MKSDINGNVATVSGEIVNELSVQKTIEGKFTATRYGGNRFTILKNGIANVARGGVAALVALGVTPFLTRKMSAEEYGAWALTLQLAAYTAYLDFGIQTAIGRFVAFATERQEQQHRNEIVSTSFALLLCSMVLSLVVIGVVAWQLPHLFHHMPAALRFQARIGLLLVGGSLAVGLPASVFSGIFVGLQRNEIPAIVIGVSRLVIAVLMVVIVWNGGRIIPMSIAMLAVNILSYFALFRIYKRIAPEIVLSLKLISKNARLELFDYCYSLSVWSFATLLVTGLDTVLVAFFDFHSVAYYSTAAVLITFILGLQNALFSALIPAAAVLDAQGNIAQLRQLLISTTRYGMFLLLVSGIPLIIWAHPILSLWVGKEYAGHTELLLQLLVLANIIRLSAVPYAMFLIGTGQQRLVTISPLIEGFSNLIVSILAGWFMGAVGVALGTLIGSIIGIACNLVYNMPRSTTLRINRWIYLKDGIFRPLFCTAPVFLVFFLQRIWPVLPPNGTPSFFAGAFFLTIIGFWKFGLEGRERYRLLAILGFRSQAA